MVVVGVIAWGAVLNHIRAGDEVLSGYPQTSTGAEQAGMQFAAQFFDDGPNQAAVQTLVANNVPTNYASGLMAEYQTLDAGFNSAVAHGLNPVQRVVATGCNVNMSSDTTSAEVDLNEHWTVQAAGVKSIDGHLAVVMHVEWLSGRWQVDGMSAGPLGNAGSPTSFTACP